MTSYKKIPEIMVVLHIEGYAGCMSATIRLTTNSLIRAVLFTKHYIEIIEPREKVVLVVGGRMLYSTLLYSTLLYSTLLYSTLLYYLILCYTILVYNMPYIYSTSCSVLVKVMEALLIQQPLGSIGVAAAQNAPHQELLLGLFGGRLKGFWIGLVTL